MEIRVARVAQLGLTLLTVTVPVAARAVEHVTLKNGQEFDCVRREADGDKIRLYLSPQSYVVVPAETVDRIENKPDPVDVPAPLAVPKAASLTAVMARAGAAHRIDVDLLASVIHAESGGRTTAVSRAGARGLMQLMPGTAAELGVADAFVAEQNIAGGTAYLDRLLTRYHDDVQKALAAYNAGPAAVDRYHGVPPFRETREYVTRVINEYNWRKKQLPNPSGIKQLVAAK
jgi:soluble lytic murein transglycosylase-like protein